MHTVSRLRSVIAGILAAAFGIAAGHLVAAFTNPEASPVLAVGSAVIDRTPTPLKDWAIREFGTHDKLVLVGSVAAGTIVLAAISGYVARQHLALGIAIQVVLVAIACYAALSRPASTPSYTIPSVVALLVGIPVLVGLLRLATGGLPALREPISLRLNAIDEPTARNGNAATRRAFLTGTGAVTTAVVGTAVLGQHLSTASSTSRLAIPEPATPLKPLPAGLDATYKQITPLTTPNGSFYRVDTALTVPNVDRDSWKLHIEGMVNKPITLSYKDIEGMDLIERDITMTCVSNEVGGGYAGGARWLGVRTADLLKLVGVQGAGKPGMQVFSTSVDGFTISTPLEALMDDRDALLAIGMNGEALPRNHGFPARLITPGLYGMLGGTKWVSKLKVTTYQSDSAYWTQRKWTTDGPIKPTARIDSPKPLSTTPQGKTLVGGIAWAQRHGVAKVQVKLDDGPWQDAMMGPAINEDYWRQWFLMVEVTGSGQHSVQARVIYGDGQVQTETRAPVFPNGSSGIQQTVFLAK